MLQDLSASVFFPPCSQHRTLGVYEILKKYYFFYFFLILFYFFFSRNLLSILHVIFVFVSVVVRLCTG